MTESYFQSRQREELAACRSRFERAQQKLTTHDEYVRYERKHPGRIQFFMKCAAEQLDKAEQLIDAMKGPEQKARWTYFLTVLQQAIDYMVMAKDDLERSEVISEHSEVVSILNEGISKLSEAISKLSEKLEGMKASYVERANQRHADTNKIKAEIKKDWELKRPGELNSITMKRFIMEVKEERKFPKYSSTLYGWMKQWKKEHPL